MKIEDLYRYSWFSDLAYVEWSKAPRIPRNPAKADAADLTKAANAAKRIPGDPDHPGVDNLGDLIFMEPKDGGLGWQIITFNVNAFADSGLVGSLFEYSNTQDSPFVSRSCVRENHE